MSAHILDGLMGVLGYERKRLRPPLALDVSPERDGYKAQYELAERRLALANRRLEAVGLMPVTGFIARERP